MIPIVENWAVILGEVLDLVPAAELHGFTAVVVWVEKVESVEGFPNLVATYLAEAGKPRLSVLMPEELVLGLHLAAGVLIECRVRRAGPERVFADRDTVLVVDAS